MKVEVVVERHGVSVGVATAAANVPEADLIGPALVTVPEDVRLAEGVPVIADRAYDSDPLRAELADGGFTIISPHRKNRKKAPTNDGRRLRRYKRRWIVERTIGWLHSFRRLTTRREWYSHLFDGFLHAACALVALMRF